MSMCIFISSVRRSKGPQVLYLLYTYSIVKWVGINSEPRDHWEISAQYTKASVAKWQKFTKPLH